MHTESIGKCQLSFRNMIKLRKQQDPIWRTKSQSHLKSHHPNRLEVIETEYGEEYKTTRKNISTNMEALRAHKDAFNSLISDLDSTTRALFTEENTDGEI